MAAILFFLLTPRSVRGVWCQVSSIFVDQRLIGATIRIRDSSDKRNRQYDGRVVGYDAEHGEHYVIIHERGRAGGGAASNDIVCHRMRLDRAQFRILQLPGTNLNFKMFFLKWDIGVFVAIAVPGFIAMFMYANAFWQKMALIYWGKALYQLLSLPFLLMKIPFFMRLITQTRKTGFNKRTGKLEGHQKKMLHYPDYMKRLNKRQQNDAEQHAGAVITDGHLCTLGLECAWCKESRYAKELTKKAKHEARAKSTNETEHA
jgi:hypothetical protein